MWRFVCVGGKLYCNVRATGEKGNEVWLLICGFLETSSFAKFTVS